MSTWVISASIVAALLAVTLGILLFRILLYRHQIANEEVPEFSLSRYQPMTQLMTGEDVQFFSGQPGVTRGQWQNFKRNRRRIFRLYLRELAADFQCLHRRAREIVAEVPEDHSVLVGSVLRLQVDFWRFLALIEVQLALDGLGLGTVDSRRLLETINALHTAVSGASPNRGPIMV
jgi:hypothetical protein